MGGFVQVLETIPVRAAFSASPRKVKIGEEALFALESSAGVTAVTWDFSDGVYATNVVIRHAFAKAGSYTVKAVVEGPAGTDSDEAGVEVFSELPVSAAFSVSPRKAKVGEELLFTLDSPAGVSLATWNLGDGSRGSNSLVRHTYSKVGDYDVSVEVSGPGGHDATTRRSCVHIQAEVPLEAAFSWAPRTVIAGQELELIDESSGGPTRWTWEIQGVGSRTGRAPAVTFVNAGSFPVTLTVENEGQWATISKSVQVVPPIPQLLQALFEVGPVTGTSPLRVHFKDQSKGAIAKYAWDFGDGQSSDLQNPVHVYKVDGQRAFHPRLMVRDSKGQEAKDSGAVVVSVVPAPPWWRWPAAGLTVLTLIGAWALARNKPTPLVGKVAWQEQGQTKRRELERTGFDLATLPIERHRPRKICA
jgi:PKD repeat protein